MSNIPSNKKINLETVKKELRSELKEYVQNYVSDVLDGVIVREDGGDVGDDDPGISDPEPPDEPEVDSALSLLFKNNNGKYVLPINPENNELREFGSISEPDGQGNVSATVLAKIEEDLKENPAYYRVTYQLID
jgi:hypothetical protein